MRDLDNIGVAEAIVEPALSRQRQALKVTLLVVEPRCAIQVSCFEFFGQGMNRAEDSAEIGALVDIGDPAFQAGEVIAFQAQARVDAAREFGAGLLHHVDVLRQLGERHAQAGVPTLGHGAVAGEGDAAQTHLQGALGVCAEGTAGVFAEGGVHVGVVHVRLIRHGVSWLGADAVYCGGDGG